MTRTGRSSVCATASTMNALNNSPPARRGEMSRSDRGGSPAPQRFGPPCTLRRPWELLVSEARSGCGRPIPPWACLPSWTASVTAGRGSSWPADCCWNRSRRSTIPATRSDSSRITPALHIVPQRKRECSTISRRFYVQVSELFVPGNALPADAVLVQVSRSTDRSRARWQRQCRNGARSQNLRRFPGQRPAVGSGCGLDRRVRQPAQFVGR